MLSLDDLELRYGSSVAYSLLLQIEKAACISSWQVAELDPNVRFAEAIKAQDIALSTHMAA